MSGTVEFDKAKYERIVELVRAAEQEVLKRSGPESSEFKNIHGARLLLEEPEGTKVDPVIAASAITTAGVVIASLITAYGGDAIDPVEFENLCEADRAVNEFIIEGDLNVEGDIRIDGGEFPETSDDDTGKQFEDASEDEDSGPPVSVFTPDEAEPPADSSSAVSPPPLKPDSSPDEGGQITGAVVENVAGTVEGESIAEPDAPTERTIGLPTIQGVQLHPPSVSNQTIGGAASVEGSSTISGTGHVTEGTASSSPAGDDGWLTELGADNRTEAARGKAGSSLRRALRRLTRDAD